MPSHTLKKYCENEEYITSSTVTCAMNGSKLILRWEQLRKPKISHKLLL